MIRENLKEKKREYEEDLNIIRHAIAHNQITADGAGYIFRCDKGIKRLDYSDVINFCEKIEWDFCKDLLLLQNECHSCLD